MLPNKWNYMISTKKYVEMDFIICLTLAMLELFLFSVLWHLQKKWHSGTATRGVFTIESSYFVQLQCQCRKFYFMESSWQIDGIFKWLCVCNQVTEHDLVGILMNLDFNMKIFSFLDLEIQTSMCKIYSCYCHWYPKQAQVFAFFGPRFLMRKNWQLTRWWLKWWMILFMGWNPMKQNQQPDPEGRKNHTSWPSASILK